MLGLSALNKREEVDPWWFIFTISVLVHFLTAPFLIGVAERDYLIRRDIGCVHVGALWCLSGVRDWDIGWPDDGWPRGNTFNAR